ncbi:hypothetical protein BCR32DRAFT_327963 [Anaeromyces robustus]|uniref:Uncharacterized protein n=1 Tax=Anaeromyces robustus TaxID=1754192 RepID=A0A1Y1X201_9FUNG|nr:hypothetical protein BCR32DRAFT_327963 [Anaeromyces robustus]|eukprot:ORX79830.1 hypothetical protein BCR32DRAFT_327963 [Anaeromyces robustus]
MIHLLLVKIFLSILFLTNSIDAVPIVDYKPLLLGEIDELMDQIYSINNLSKECVDAYTKIHDCPFSDDSLISYDRLCNNLSECKDIFKTFEDFEKVMAPCNNSYEYNNELFLKYNGIARFFIQHIEAYCFEDENGKLCPISERLRSDDINTNILVVNSDEEVRDRIDNIKYYPNQIIKDTKFDLLKENCYSEKCKYHLLDYIGNCWTEINYLTEEEVEFKKKQISYILGDKCF